MLCNTVGRVLVLASFILAANMQNSYSQDISKETARALHTNGITIPENLAEQVEPIVREAGKILMGFLDKKHTIVEKEDTSFVTEADFASERFLIKKLQEVFPRAGFLAEESGMSVANGGEKGDYQWVIDPLDGTSNFAHRFPYFAISVGLTYKGEPVFGMIYGPYYDEMFYATKGKGAFMNGKRLSLTTDIKPLRKRIVATGGPADPTTRKIYAAKCDIIHREVKSYRKMGSAALDLANVAAGRIDALFFGKIGWWDIVAGTVIIREAGGVVTDLGKDTVREGYDYCLAGHIAAYSQLQTVLN